MSNDNIEKMFRCLGLCAVGFQVYAYGPSLGLALTHGVIVYCIFFNRERKK